MRTNGVSNGDRAEWQYFRFYEPEYATPYENAIRAWPDRMAQYYQLSEEELVDRIITESYIATTVRNFDPEPAALPKARPPAFVFRSCDA